MDRYILKTALVTLCFLPFIALIVFLTGNEHLLVGFWYDYKWFVLLLVVLIGGSTLIYKLVKKR